MSKLVCRGCGSIIDAAGIGPFTLCTCSGCGTELIIPLEMDYLTLEKPLYEKSLFSVYEGFDKELNTCSIIYMLYKDNPGFNQFCKIAREEVLALSTLKHPNICPILNYGEIDGNFFVTEPMMDGYALSDYSPETQGLLDVEEVIDVLLAAALGLAIAHHKEFVHHDLCPDNIHIDARGNVRMKNFFISRFTYEYLRDKEEIATSVSPYFISPEKVETHVEDKRGDMFSFGVIFYYMLTGKYPFSGKNEVETVYSRVKKRKPPQFQVFSTEKPQILAPATVDYLPPSPPVYHRSDIPGEISNTILDMLSYHPVRRPRFTEVLSRINLYKAMEDKEKLVHSAQKTMVREIVTTKTKAIPIMKNLSSNSNLQKAKSETWL